jgi:hypothetical protein
VQKWSRKPSLRNKTTGKTFGDIVEQITEQPDVLENVITCDEMWIFQHDTGMKKQSMRWKTTTSPRMKKSNNEQLESEGNNDCFLRHQRRNHD